MLQVLFANSFVGDGSGLTGVTAVGTGVSVFDSDTLIGVGSAFNFGANLSVSPVNAGIVTVTGSGGESFWSSEQTNAGIHTTSAFVGIATTNPVNALGLEMQISLAISLVTGVVTTACCNRRICCYNQLWFVAANDVISPPMRLTPIFLVFLQ